tara:strand:- start:80 stop:802 length:723 start_codon:yes stop_codon:yes gene_type:complete
MKIIINVAILFLLNSTVCLGDSSLEKLSDRKILSFLEDTALSWNWSENLTSSEEKMCKKRTQEIKVFLAGDWGGTPEYIFKRCGQEISMLTDLNVSYVSDPSNCNLYVGMGFDAMKDYYKDWKKKSGIQNHSYDSFIRDLNDDFEIKHSGGFINSRFIKNERMIEFYSFKILATSLGFTDFSRDYKDSIFLTPFNTGRPPCSLDKFIIRLLYQKQIKPKMKIYDISKIVRSQKLINKLRI